MFKKSNTGTNKSAPKNIPLKMVLGFFISFQLIKIYNNIGNINRAMLYLVKKASIAIGNAK